MSSRVYVLDGGLGSELQRRGTDTEDDPLFGSSALLYSSQDIYMVHNSFLESGADLICTATYQASLQGYCEFLGVCVDEAKRLIIKAAHIAIGACNDFWGKLSKLKNFDRVKPKAVGSIGPYGATLLDGSEYHGLYADNMTIEQIKEWHRPRIQCLVDGGIDTLALETIPCIKEGVALVQLLKEFPVKAWLSFSCMDGSHTCHGEKFQDAIQNCLQYDSDRRLMAVGVNCTKPIFISSLLDNGKSARKHLPFIVYPNSGEQWISKKQWVKQEDIPKISSFVNEWQSLGASYIGGCCRVTANDIAEIRKEIDKSRKMFPTAKSFFGL